MSVPMFVINSKVAEEFVREVRAMGFECTSRSDAIVILATDPDFTLVLGFRDQEVPGLCMFEHVDCPFKFRRAERKLVAELEELLIRLGGIDFADYNDKDNSQI